jgi:hypothetical protein
VNRVAEVIAVLRFGEPEPGVQISRTGLFGSWSNGMDIDRQHIAAVRRLEALGFRCRDGEWLAGDSYAMALPFTAKADAKAYEGKRWPLGKEPGEKG